MSEPLYSFSPKRAYIVEGVFLAVLGPATFYMISTGVWPLAAVFGYLSLRGIWKILTTPRIDISLDLPDCIYSSRSLLRRKLTRIPIERIKGATSEIVSMWRGNITEKMVLQIHDHRDLLLNPVCSPNSLEAGKIYAAVRHLTEAGEEYRKKQLREAAKAAAKELPRKRSVTRTLWGMLEMSVSCPSCDSPVPVNGPWTSVQCMNCLDTIEIAPETWADLLEDIGKGIARDLKEGEGSSSHILGVLNTTLLSARLKPYCPECKKDLDLEGDLSGDEIICSECGTSLPVIAPPEWFEKVFRKADLIIGATRSTEKHGEPPEPVVLTCSSCGASFETTGETRDALCDHCGTSFYLPDDLWYVFHPAPVKRRWFTRFRARVKSREA